MNAHVSAIAYYLPEHFQSNADLALENPDWDVEKIAEKSGVFGRHIAGDAETAFDLGLKACQRLFTGPGVTGTPDVATVDAIIFCTQSPDYVMPSNAHLLHKALHLGDQVLAFDINLACSGYVYALALGQSLIQSGFAQTLLLVNADTYSKYIGPSDRSVRVLFGDGAAATLLTATSGPQELRGFELWSRGKDFDRFIIPAGGMRTPKTSTIADSVADRHGNIRRPDHIHMDGMAIWAFVNSAVPKQIAALLARHHLALSDIDLFAFHQASKMTLDSLTKILKIPPDKVLTNLAKIGNTVSASLPILLKDALDAGTIRAGHRVLLAGFGVGLSYASAIWEVQ